MDTLRFMFFVDFLCVATIALISISVRLPLHQSGGEYRMLDANVFPDGD